MNNVKAIQRTLNQTSQWLRDMLEVYDFADEDKAFILLKATLKTLRDRISPGEAFHLGAQLPALVRGFYYEGWDPDKKPTTDRTKFDFLTTVKVNLAGHDDIDLEMAVPEVLKLILNKIDQGEAEQVKHNLPSDIQELFS